MVAYPRVAVMIMHLDLARDRALTPAMTERFLTLARYAVDNGARVINCSLAGSNVSPPSLVANRETRTWSLLPVCGPE